ncbi:MAG: hypothetical protein LH650_10865, partial [Chloroflexi bacterium]|nr:hypothetical protein [Chloroflexota bacterium]
GQLLVLGRRGPAGGRGLNSHGVTAKALWEVPCSLFVVAPNGKRLLDVPAHLIGAAEQVAVAFVEP